jgi:hypothetical protein
VQAQARCAVPFRIASLRPLTTYQAAFSRLRLHVTACGQEQERVASLLQTLALALARLLERSIQLLTGTNQVHLLYSLVLNYVTKKSCAPHIGYPYCTQSNVQVYNQST